LVNEKGLEYQLGDKNLFVCKNEMILDFLREYILN
jgi:hypothetical protein